MSTDSVIREVSRDCGTLADWCNRNGISPTHPTTERGAVSVVFNVGQLAEGELWSFYHLSDFAVSSRSGPVVWLVPIAGRCGACGLPIRDGSCLHCPPSN
jgi:hypothetical protein